MENSNSPEQLPVNEIRRIAFARKAVALAEKLGEYDEERTYLPRVEPEISQETGILELVALDAQAMFAVDGAYVSLHTRRETEHYIDTSRMPTTRESVEMKVATPLIYEGVTYWSVELYLMEPNLGSYEDLLYSDEVDSQGNWKQFVPKDVYDFNKDRAAFIKNRAARKARTTLTFSHYTRAESVLNKLEESYVLPEVPEIFIPRTFTREPMNPI